MAILTYMGNVNTTISKQIFRRRNIGKGRKTIPHLNEKVWPRNYTIIEENHNGGNVDSLLPRKHT